jgi:MoaA/NifB/PqqE/SkfB family radical SAM enzyme
MLVHGGEALLRKDIGYIIDYIKTKGIYVCLVTNGQLFPRRIEELRNVDNITVSLDGSPRNNDLNRGEGTHNYALTAIKLALAEGFKVRVSCTLSQNNKDDIHYLAELAKSLGVPVSFSILFKTDFTKPDEDFLALNPDEIRHCIRTIKQLKHKGFPLFTSNLNLDYALSWPYERFNKLFLMKDQVPSNFKHMRCHYGTLKFHLEGDGRVMPCTILSANSFESKSVLKVSTREALQHVHETNKCVALQFRLSHGIRILSAFLTMSPETSRRRHSKWSVPVSQTDARISI